MDLFKGYSGPPIKLEHTGQWGELAMVLYIYIDMYTCMIYDALCIYVHDIYTYPIASFGTCFVAG